MNGQIPGPSPIVSSDDRAKTWLILAGGLVATVALVVGVIAFWPDSDDSVAAGSDGTTTSQGGFEPGISDGLTDEGDDQGSPATSLGQGEPSERTTTVPAIGDDLFGGDFASAYPQLLSEAGDPTQLIEVAVYDSYAFVAYVDPANPANIDRRDWRDGEVSDAEPNTIEDRVDDSTQPSLFGPAELDAALIPQLVADAPSHYDIPTEVSHIIVDRFLPFDDRVLIRVYATPTDGRSGGGYVSYDTTGTLVKICC